MAAGRPGPHHGETGMAEKENVNIADGTISDIDGMPGAEGFREGPPFTAVFADIDEGVKEPAVINFYISPLLREQTENLFSLFPC
jgi:hypothetical protein